MGTLDGLGSEFNFVGFASGIHINMARAEAVTFVSWKAAGDQVLTLKESVAGSGEQALTVIDEVWKAARTGGVWTRVTQTVSDSYTHADGTKNATSFTVHAAQLSAGFNYIECTASGGGLFAVLHGLNQASGPTSLASTIA